MEKEQQQRTCIVTDYVKGNEQSQTTGNARTKELETSNINGPAAERTKNERHETAIDGERNRKGND